MPTIAFEKVTVSDLRKHPVWELVTESDDFGCLMAESVDMLPVSSLANRIVATDFALPDGEVLFGFLQNVCLKDSKANLHLVQPTFALPNEWFTMARYFDPDYGRNGPARLARILGKPLASVFPMQYDISAVAAGPPEVIRGEIAERSKERLTDEEIVDLAVSLTRR